MKTFTVLVVLSVLVLGIGGNALGYTGGSKAVVTMGRLEPITETGPAPILSYDLWRSSKPILQLLNRLPEPTLAAERIRVETPGPSLGTKGVVLFQGGW